VVCEDYEKSPVSSVIGHVDGFSDPMVDCKESKLRFRADQLFYSPVKEEGSDEILGYVCVQEASDEDMETASKTQARALLKSLEKSKGTALEPFQFECLIDAPNDLITSSIPSPATGQPTLTEPRDFNLMFATQVGALADESAKAYLRPETAQGIFLNFKNCALPKLPAGIGQIGKAFRNEITPRNFIFRSREFEQMEVEYFIPPGDDVWPKYHQEWIDASYHFLVEDCGLDPEKMGWDVHEGDSLAHYARACTDVTFDFPFGTQELMGIAARGNYDLTKHTEGSGKCTYPVFL